MTTAAADGHEADDLFLCFFPIQQTSNQENPAWELDEGESALAALEQRVQSFNRAVECNCACK